MVKCGWLPAATEDGCPSNPRRLPSDPVSSGTLPPGLPIVGEAMSSVSLGVDQKTTSLRELCLLLVKIFILG